MKTKNGTAVTLRPIRPEDEPLLVAFHKALSDASVYSRYAERLNLNERTTHERLIKMCHIDYDHEMALVATKTGTNGDEVIAAGRLSLVRGTKEAIFALQVTDSMQGQGVGHEMLRRLIMIAKDKKMSRVIAVMLPDNKAMKHICEREDFKVTMNEKDGVLNAQLSI
ncbi:MAG: hypothetical protein A2428_12590 [Bdellovibrionales bacterium RIFOXYC1_FULL_54_43]|nr:MAG: hypothetical protein A2428_12590 [Bdellovibrionales bacterium RIFOXYC1_FULL_54_43]